MQTELICQACQIEAPTRQVLFNRNIGALVVRYHKRVRGRLCKRCIHKYYWSYTLTTLSVGWLGTVSLIMAPIFIIGNTAAYIGSVRLKPPAKGAMPLLLTAEAGRSLVPFSAELTKRLGSGENLDVVAQDVAKRARVTPGQTVLFVADMLRQAPFAVAQKPTGGFPVVPLTTPPPLAAANEPTGDVPEIPPNIEI